MALNIVVCNGAKHLGISPTISTDYKRFTSEEILVKVNARCGLATKDVYVVQSFKDPNTALMELILTVDALKGKMCKSITAVIPYFPYGRQDKRHQNGTPISARIVCKMLESVGVTRIIACDLHSDQIQGFATVPFLHIKMGAFFSHHVKQEFPDFGDGSWKFVGADLGASKRNKAFAGLNGSKKVCNIIKYREEDQEVEEVQLIGKVKGYNAVLYDDMLDTGGTISSSYDLLKELGALRVIAIGTHPVFSAPDKVKKNLDKVTIFSSNTCEHDYRPSKTSIFDIKDFMLQIMSGLDNGKNIEDLPYYSHV
jgi:ribose-phosphate pyrophosphokinase